MGINCTFSREVAGDRVKMVLLFPILLTNAYQKTFNFVNTDRPCCKKAKAYQKTFTTYELDLNICYDYETTNDCQLCNSS